MATENETAAAEPDLLYGANAIAEFLGLRTPQVRVRIEEGRIPAFKIGGTICSRRSTLRDWMAKAEAANRIGG